MGDTALTQRAVLGTRLNDTRPTAWIARLDPDGTRRLI